MMQAGDEASSPVFVFLEQLMRGTALQIGPQDQKVKPPKKYHTSLLPGFELDVAAVLQAARKVQ